MATDEAAFDKFVTAFIDGFGDRARSVAEQQAASSQNEAARSAWAAIAVSVRSRQAEAILLREYANHAGMQRPSPPERMADEGPVFRSCQD